MGPGRDVAIYAKIFSSLWDGTLYGKADAQLVFIFMLARCNQDGFLRVVPEAIAGPTGLSLERVSAALAFLEAPDPESGSPDEEGCRIVPIAPGTWTITNYAKYRNMRDADTVRSQTRERLAKHREKKRTVTLGNAPKRQAEVEVDTEAEAKQGTDSDLRSSSVGGLSPKPPRSSGDEPSGDRQTAKDAFEKDFWPRYPLKVGRIAAQREFLKLVKDGPESDALFDRIMDGLDWYKREVWPKQEKITHARTWLYQRRFDDAPPSLIRSA